MACNPARQACRACTPVWRACKACTPFGQACRLCTPVGSRKPPDSRGLCKPRNWCYGLRSSNCAAHKPATKFNHPDPQANDRPRPTDTHQTQPSRPHQTPRPHIKPKRGLPSPSWANWKLCSPKGACLAPLGPEKSTHNPK
ncbi:hypothetical protein PCANC_25482 [Puccinia coronata f. sp. avenae]|uniref:Uncharacterized protein n=1 Tax=Puccinia coronata f. sp. avenae TaxID=200324 RepID=A0A2N5SP63_9BASI|nr:hypothetical protein PCANC_25482 [Puccinia coronata f. sp. avenae]